MYIFEKGDNLFYKEIFAHYFLYPTEVSGALFRHHVPTHCIMWNDQLPTSPLPVQQKIHKQEGSSGIHGNEDLQETNGIFLSCPLQFCLSVIYFRSFIEAISE